MVDLINKLRLAGVIVNDSGVWLSEVTSNNINMLSHSNKTLRGISSNAYHSLCALVERYPNYATVLNNVHLILTNIDFDSADYLKIELKSSVADSFSLSVEGIPKPHSVMYTLDIQSTTQAKKVKHEVSSTVPLVVGVTNKTDVETKTRNITIGENIKMLSVLDSECEEATIKLNGKINLLEVNGQRLRHLKLYGELKNTGIVAPGMYDMTINDVVIDLDDRGRVMHVIKQYVDIYKACYVYTINSLFTNDRALRGELDYEDFDNLSGVTLIQDAEMGFMGTQDVLVSNKVINEYKHLDINEYTVWDLLLKPKSNPYL